MSKTIKKIDQLDEGGTNPKSGIHESTLWRLHFEDDSEPRILGRVKMLEYLSKGTMPPKTAFSFKKWDLTIPFPELEEVNETYNISIPTKKITRTWSVVYDDKQHIQLISKDFYALITNGHRNKDEEKLKEIEEQILKKHESVPQNEALFHKPTNKPKSVTTDEERKELDDFRAKVMAESMSGN